MAAAMKMSARRNLPPASLKGAEGAEKGAEDGYTWLLERESRRKNVYRPLRSRTLRKRRKTRERFTLAADDADFASAQWKARALCSVPYFRC